MKIHAQKKLRAEHFYPLRSRVVSWLLWLLRILTFQCFWPFLSKTQKHPQCHNRLIISMPDFDIAFKLDISSKNEENKRTLRGHVKISFVTTFGNWTNTTICIQSVWWIIRITHNSWPPRGSDHWCKRLSGSSELTFRGNSQPWKCFQLPRNGVPPCNGYWKHPTNWKPCSGRGLVWKCNISKTTAIQVIFQRVKMSSHMMRRKQSFSKKRCFFGYWASTKGFWQLDYLHLIKGFTKLSSCKTFRKIKPDIISNDQLYQLTNTIPLSSCVRKTFLQ